MKEARQPKSKVYHKRPIAIDSDARILVSIEEFLGAIPIERRAQLLADASDSEDRALARQRQRTAIEVPSVRASVEVSS